MNDQMLKLQAEIQLVYASVNAVNIRIMQTYNRFHQTESWYTSQLLGMRDQVDKLARQFFEIGNEFNKQYDPTRWEDTEV